MQSFPVVKSGVFGCSCNVRFSNRNWNDKTLLARVEKRMETTNPSTKIAKEHKFCLMLFEQIKLLLSALSYKHSYLLILEISALAVAAKVVFVLMSCPIKSK